MMKAATAFYRLLRRKVRTRLFGRKPIRSRGPAARIVRRLAPVAGVVGLASLAFGFAADVSSLRTRTCSMPLAQPGISDLCARLGIDGFPSREERLAWEALPAGDCQAVRHFLDRFPAGVKKEEAVSRLRSPIVERSAQTVETTRVVIGYVRQSEFGFPSAAEARLDAIARARRDAEQLLCLPRLDTEQFSSAQVRPAAFDCRTLPGRGSVCSLDYQIMCRMKERPLVARC